MNSPTDRERPALSEALAERVQYELYCLTPGERQHVLMGELLAFLKAIASPKPALTQGGVVELVEAYRVRVLRVMNRNKMVSDVELAILIAKDLAATALERLAVEDKPK